LSLARLLFIICFLTACEKVKYGTEDTPILSAHQLQCGYTRPGSPVTSTIAITNPARDQYIRNPVLLEGNCQGSTTVDLSGAGLPAPVSIACANGRFSQTITFTAGDGLKDIVATQAGSADQFRFCVYIDMTPPVVSITSPAPGSLSNGSVTVGGTCESGFNVNLSGNLSAPVSVPCNGGQFTAGVSLDAVDGTRTINAEQTDNVGNTGSDSSTVVRDTTAPVITIAAPAAGTVAQTGLTVSGACSAGLPVQVAGPGVTAPLTTTCASGTWSQAITFSSGDGVKTVTATQRDPAGNTGSAQRDFVRDSTPPAIAITSPFAGFTTNSSFSLSGNCTAGLTVSITGQITAPVTTACPSGTFTQTVTLAGPDGAKTVSASQTDAAGNSATDSRGFVLLTAGPSVQITAPALNAFIPSPFTVSGTCTNGLPVQLSGAGIAAPATATCTAGAFSASLTPTAGDGSKLVTATQTDAAGNSGSNSRTFIRDTTAPSIAITGPAAGTNTISTITVTGTCTAGLNVSLSGQIAAPITAACPSGTFAATVTLATPDGTKNVTASQTDAAGNTGSDSRSFTLDTAAPVVAITAPAANSYVTATFTVSGTCTSGLNVQLGGAGLTAVTNTACNAGAFSASVTATAGDGSKLVTATQTDAAGNAGSNSRTFLRDSTAPVVTIATPAANSTITQAFTITGQCQANLALNISGDLTAPVTLTCPAGGTYSANLNATPAGGTKNVTASQTDAAGNTGTATRAFVLTTASTATETFTADASEGKVDILFVDDNSASMEFEQRALGQRFPSFVNELAGIDWQIGITTTDCSTGPYGICGSLLQMVGTATNILTSAIAGFDMVFRNTIERPETVDCVARGLCPSGLEEALRAANTAMDKRNTNNAGFFRNGAALALVVLTDEDEGSDAPVTATTPQQVVNHFNSIWGATKRFKSYAITTLPGDAACLAAQQAQQGGIGFYGTYAVGLANLTGGRSVSICAPDYSVTLQQIGQDLRTVTSAVQLTRVPLAGSVQVQFMPAQSIAFSVRGDTVLFAQPVPAGTQIRVTYQY
jgi:hypothetical protein